MHLVRTVVVEAPLFLGMGVGAGYVLATLVTWQLSGELPLPLVYWFGLVPACMFVGVLLLSANRILSWLMMGFGLFAGAAFAAHFLIAYLASLASGSLGR